MTLRPPPPPLPPPPPPHLLSSQHIYPHHLPRPCHCTYPAHLSPTPINLYPHPSSHLCTPPSSLPSPPHLPPGTAATTTPLVVYKLRARLRSTLTINETSMAWDVETPIDLTHHVKLQGGQAYVGFIGEEALRSHRINTQQ